MPPGSGRGSPARFDLLVKLRGDGHALSPELGEVLVGEAGAAEGDLAKLLNDLLNDGQVRLRLGLDPVEAMSRVSRLQRIGLDAGLVESGQNDPSPESSTDPLRDPNPPGSRHPVPPANEVSDAAFAPRPEWRDDGALTLEDRGPPPGLPTAASSHDEAPATARAPRSPREKSAPSICPDCGALRAGDDCARCAEGGGTVGEPDRRGIAALRERPPLRFLVGVVIALGAGYVVSAPAARSAETRIEALRTEANAHRYRNDPAEQAQCAAFDAQADEAASGAFYRVGLIWLGTALLGFAAWMVFT